MDEQEVSLVYRNRYNEVKPYRVLLRAKTDTYQYVFDLHANKQKTFLLNNVLFNTGNHSHAIAHAGLLQENFTIKPRPKKGVSRLQNGRKRPKGNRFDKFEVCFTGFPRVERLGLIVLAEESDFYVTNGVTKNLSLLVCSDNPGASKLNKAQEQNVPVIYGQTAFQDFIETGEFHE